MAFPYRPGDLFVKNEFTRLMNHRAGFVNIIGNPNVGKSTLMNALVGMKLSITTSKAQTTRHRIMGIVNGEEYQIVYSDTPGILDPKYKLQVKMLSTVRAALTAADIILYVADVSEKPELNEVLSKPILKTEVPLILALNKIDKSDQQQVESLVDGWSRLLPRAKIVPVSVKENFNIDALFKLILENLPENPPFYPKDELTDRPERFFAAEIIREKMMTGKRSRMLRKSRLNHLLKIIVSSGYGLSFMWKGILRKE